MTRFFSGHVPSYILTGLLGVLFLFSASIANAADTPTIKGISDPRNVTGYTTRTDIGFFKSITNLSCGDAFTKAGSFVIGDPVTGNQVVYGAGDTAKCSWIPLTSSATCVVGHADGTYTAYETSGVSGALTTTQFDSKGNVVGTPTQQSAVDATLVKPATNALTDALTSGLAGVGSQILQAVASAILSFANFLLGLAGAALNYVVYYAVFKFGSLIGNSPGVLLAWGILRDIANMLLLFGFIFLGVATILDSDKFATKKAIPQLLIFAILMNFSLFACEAIIDVANGTSSLLYSQADPVSAQCNGSDVGRNLGDQCSFLNYGIAGHIMQSTGLSTFWQNVTNPQANPIALLALALFATIGTIVCLAAAIMLTIRLVVLTFLMISSPIGFAGMAIPFFHKFSNDWWNRVIHQSFFAPIMFLLIFISLKLADSFSSATSQSAGLGAVATSPNALDMGVILVFMLVCGFLLASIIVAHRFGAMGAQGAIGFSKKLVLGAYGGIGGVAGTNTLGRSGAAFQKRYQQWAGNRGRLARTVLINSGLDAGIMKASDKVKNSKYGGTKSYAEVQKNLEVRSGALAHAAEAAKLGAELNGGIAKGDDKAIARTLQEMSASDIAQTEYVKQGTEGINILARNLSPEKFDEMMKNKDLEADKKERLIKGRFSELEGKDGHIKKENDKEIKKWSAKDLGQLAKYNGHLFDELITAEKENGESLLSSDQFDALLKNDTLTNTQKQLVKENSLGSRIEAALEESKKQRALGEVAKAAELESRAKVLLESIGGNKNRAKLSAKVLTDPTIAKDLSVPELLAIVTEDKLSEPDRKKLAARIQDRKGEKSIGQLLDPNLNQVAAAYYTP